MQPSYIKVGQIFIYVLLSFCMIILKPNVEQEFNENLVISYLIIMLLSLLVHYIAIRTQNFFTIATLFLLGFVIVHFQWALMLSVSNIEPFLLQITPSYYSYINFSTWLSCIGLISWQIGYAIINKSFKFRSNGQIIYHYKKLLYLTIFCFVIFVISVGSGYFLGGVYAGDAVDTGIGFYVFKVLDALTLALILATIVNNKHLYKNSSIKWFMSLNKIFVVFLSVQIILFLIVGDRGPAIKYTFAFLVLYSASIKPINFRSFLFLVVLGAFLLTIVGLSRSGSEFELQKLEELGAYGLTAELSDSMRTLCFSLWQVPRYDDYFYGKLWVGNFLAIVPMLSSVYTMATGIYFSDSPIYITYTLFGANAASGEGTSLIADIYLNFGSVGVVVTMFLLGMLLKKLDMSLAISRNIYIVTIAMAIGSLAFYWGRAPLFVSLQSMVWCLIIVRIFAGKKT